MIYFDNAATTFPKPQAVIDSVHECITEYCGNSGRSGHYMSLLTSEKIYEAREKIADLISVDDPAKIIFTQNATHALNLAIKTSVKPSTHVLISDLEHNSVLRPIHALCEKENVTYSIFKSDGDLEKNIEKQLTPNSKYIISTLASNVNGREIDTKKLSRVANKYNLCLITDASQLIGHKKISIEETPVNILCAPVHKALFGIQGAGFAVFNDQILRDTLYEGGSGSSSKDLKMPQELPERFEAGTLPSPAIISVIEGIKFIEQNGIAEIERKIEHLSSILYSRIKNIKGIKTYGYNLGVISFNFKSIPSASLSYYLDKNNIYTRSGLHCAPLAHKTIGTAAQGTVRVSLSFFNTEEEIDEFYKVLSEICRIYF